MRKGQLEVLFAIGFFFVFIAVAVVWSYGLPSNRALSRQVEDIKPYRRSMYLTQNLEPLYVEPAFKYSLQHASYQVASSESLSVWTPDAVDSTTPTLEERIRQQLEAEAFRTFRSKMQSLTFRGNCTLVNFDRDAASFYQITDRRTTKRGIAFSPTESSPVGVQCGVPYAKYTSYFSLANEWFAARNRYFALSDIARHIAAYPQLNCDLVDLPNHGNT
ncbi:MAG: hypothetical protein SVU32_02460, partial [Candidatus Nanohaloarchaea archaeon]|nr:hypothetical protein [Candidatus Nanohaloarchaea archaeon]